MARKVVSDQVQNNILLNSRRRCCLCFWLKGIDEVQKGQIAHLDQNNENADEENLVFLCYDHHDEYDGSTSTSKGLKEGEILKWRDELYRELEYRFRTVTDGTLNIYFDKEQHCFAGKNGAYEVYRIGVRNDGKKTVKNVSAKITSVVSDDSILNTDLRRFFGLKLAISPNPFGDYRHPDSIPESSVVLHPSDEVTFDFVRLTILPGNFSVLHSSYFRNSQTSHLESRPRGVLSPGKYTIAICVQGDDLSPREKRYEVSSSNTCVNFSAIK